MTKQLKQQCAGYGIGVILYIIVVTVVMKAAISDQNQFILFLILYLIIGFDVFRTFRDGVLEKKFRTSHFMILLAATGAFVIGRYMEGVFVILFFKLGMIFEMAVTDKEEYFAAGLQQIQSADQGKRAESEMFVTKLSRVYTLIMGVCAMVVMLVPPMTFSFGSWNDWIYRGLVFLIASCSCGLSLSVPVAFRGGITSAAEKGILFRGCNYLENLAKANIFVFGKEGVLTEGAVQEEEIKEGVQETLLYLKKKCRAVLVMMTEDKEDKSMEVAEELNMDYAYTELTPEEKLEQLEEFLFLQDDAGKVVCVGGGVSDTLIIARADAGVVTENMESSIAVKAADVIFEEDELMKLTDAVRVAKITLRAVRQNINFALTVKILVLALAVTGAWGMWQVMLAEVIVLFVTVLNAAWVVKYVA